MRKKIKEKEVFRVNKEKQIYSLLNETTGDIANLVVVYAANGSGKILFFNVIEWLMTSKSGRLNTLGAIEEVSQKDRIELILNNSS